MPPSALSPPPGTTDAFGEFARQYDAYTEHPAYSAWITGIEALARGHGLRGRRVLDLACGTGKSFLPLLELGYEVTGCDAVASMLDLARRKAGGRAVLVQADITRLPRLGAFDLVTCLNDVCNYLPDLEALERMLAGARDSLAPGGLLVFDVNTLLTFRSTFAATFVRERSGMYFVWQGRVTPDFSAGGWARADIDVFEQGPAGWSRGTSVHHPLEHVGRALERAGLETVAVLGQHDDGRRDAGVAEDSHLKALYVARRSSANGEGR
jgi:SAM-dependent methyltransferase